MPSRVRLEQIVPSTEHVAGYEKVANTAPFAGSNVGPTPPIVPGAVRTESIWFIAGEGSETQNVTGSPITLMELNDINSNFTNPIYVLPGTAGDYNNSQWKFPVPSNMRTGSPLTVRLHVIGNPTAVSPPPPPGGAEVFTGAKMLGATVAVQTISNATATQLTTVWDSTSYDNVNGTDTYWDNTNKEFVVPVGFGGYFTLKLDGRFDASTAATGEYGELWIEVNGTMVAIDSNLLNDDAYNLLQCSVDVQLADGDVVAAWCRQFSGGNLSFTRYQQSATFFSIGRWDYTPP